MFDKKAVVIATSAGASTKTTTKPVCTNLFYWGISQVKTYGARVAAACWNDVKQEKKDKITADMKKIARKLSKEKKPFVNVKTKLFFTIFTQIHKAKLDTPEENAYWEKQGWLGKERPWKK